MAGYFFGVKRGIGGIGPLDIHDNNHRMGPYQW